MGQQVGHVNEVQGESIVMSRMDGYCGLGKDRYRSGGVFVWEPRFMESGR